MQLLILCDKPEVQNLDYTLKITFWGFVFRTLGHDLHFLHFGLPSSVGFGRIMHRATLALLSGLGKSIPTATYFQ